MSNNPTGSTQPAHLSQYNYNAISSLVLTADRSVLPRRDREPDGAPTSLAGRISVAEMGSRAHGSKADPSDEVKALKSKRAKDAAKTKKEPKASSSLGMGVFSAGGDITQIEGLVYQPRTAETYEVYTLLLGAVNDILGGALSGDVVRSATDGVLEIIKADTPRKEFDIKKDVEEVLGTTVTSDDFNAMLGLARKITDWGAEQDEDANMEADEAVGIDQEGVAVLFEDSDEDEEEGGAGWEVGASDDEDENEDAEEDTKDGIMDGTGDENVQVGSTSASKRKTTSASKSDEISPASIDAFYVQRQLSALFPDALTASTKASAILTILASDASTRDAENSLIEEIEFRDDAMKLVNTLVRSRNVVVWGTKWARATAEERTALEEEMKGLGLESLADQLSRPVAGTKQESNRAEDDQMDVDEEPAQKKPTPAQGWTGKPQLPTAFPAGQPLLTTKSITLPKGSFKRARKGWEEVHIPAPSPAPLPPNEKMVKVRSEQGLPTWTHSAFEGITNLNRIQSRVFPKVWGSEQPVLVCAPTGAGKTNIALLAMLQTIAQHRDPDTGIIDLDSFKMVYVAPMKALVQEMVQGFGKRLRGLGIQVAELTGDSSLTHRQIAETHLLITTPEKWDVITRKGGDGPTSYTALVRLVIIDEIHLLHDDRGPVLEFLIARILRNQSDASTSASTPPTRLIGLSATLPNYTDVANLLRVPNDCLFHFDATFRPCPLSLQVVGITSKKAIERLRLLNEVCYEKSFEQISKGHQALIFVHSRKETGRTAKYLRDQGIEKEELDGWVRASAATREILAEEAKGVKDSVLRELLPFGFGIHHAGLGVEDRATVEELFAQGHLPTLVCTATLAWGVNLPAHFVCIKGTQVYSPSLGRWCELSSQDVLQMLGRAGRPQFDTQGEGCIVTSGENVQYYVGLGGWQVPIESRLVDRLADGLNAEIVKGSISTEKDAAEWLGCSYLFVRMLKSPSTYSVIIPDDDPTLIGKRKEIFWAAVQQLLSAGLVTGVSFGNAKVPVKSTPLGRIASYYYITYNSMVTYQKYLKDGMGVGEVMRVFCLSEEFRFVGVRSEENMELQKLHSRVPHPIKDPATSPLSKISILLQSHISRLSLNSFVLQADMVYITQNAGRILRALFEIAVAKGWFVTAVSALELGVCVERRLWKAMTPLRQFDRSVDKRFKVPADVVKRAEGKAFPWERYFDLSPEEIGELLGMSQGSAGKLVARFVGMFPRIQLAAHVQPITPSLLRVDLILTPDFRYDPKVHASNLLFHVFITDVDGAIILAYDTVFVGAPRNTADPGVYDEEITMTMTVPIGNPLPPNYFVVLKSDTWLHSETRLPLSFKHLILPALFPMHTSVLELQALPVKALHNDAFESLYTSDGSNGDIFNRIQTQTFQALYTTDENVFIGAPGGSGVLVCAEFALLRYWSSSATGKAVYLSPHSTTIPPLLAYWTSKFAALNKRLTTLSGETAADLRALEAHDLILCTPTQWDALSRRWRQRKGVQSVGLLIAGDVERIGGMGGETYEIVLSRTRYISAQLAEAGGKGKGTRIVALSTSLANAKDLGEWIGVPSYNCFNFGPSARPVPLDIHLRSVMTVGSGSATGSTQVSAKECWKVLYEHRTGKAMVFVPERRGCRILAEELVGLSAGAGGEEAPLLNVALDVISAHIQVISDPTLKECLEHGIGFLSTSSKQDRIIVERLWESGVLGVLVREKDDVWEELAPVLPKDKASAGADLVVILGTQVYDGHERRWVDYSVMEVLRMMGCASATEDQSSSRCVIFTTPAKKDFWKKFVGEGLPIESHLGNMLHDYFLAEVAVGTLESKQDAMDLLTWTYFYRRLTQNPNYYNLHNTSHQHLSDHLSDLVESTLGSLQSSRCIAIDPEDDLTVSALNLGMIAAYYGVSYVTMEVFVLSIKEKTKMRGLLEVLSSAAEFETIPIRPRETRFLTHLYSRVPVKLPAESVDLTSPHFKVFLLLQAHFSRIDLGSGDLQADLEQILAWTPRLLSAIVDVMSSEGWLGCMGAMDLGQMCVQGVWIDSQDAAVLRQVPHFDDDIVKKLGERDVKSVFDVMDMEPADREALLSDLSPAQLSDVASFVNAYPTLDVQHKLAPGPYTAGQPIALQVTLTNGDDDDDGPAPDAGNVIAPFFPHAKRAEYWIVVGNPTSKALYVIKKVTLGQGQREVRVKLEFSLEETKTKEGEELRMWVVCDSYVGADLDVPVGEGKFIVGPSADSDDDSDSDEDDDKMQE